MRLFPQVRIIHISDIHFGTDHVCRRAEAGAADAGIPKLWELIAADLQSEDWNEFRWATPLSNAEISPLLLVLSGDLAHTADNDEFRSALAFVNGLLSQSIMGKTIPLSHVFVVPGNHDVVFTKQKPEDRFTPYCKFINELFRPADRKSRPFAYPDQADTLSRIHPFPEEHLLVAEINSSYYVEKETLDESRGQVDLQAVNALRQALESIAETAKQWIKIAVVHHHPVLTPSFVEPDRGVDAILNARSLLDLLREHGFQLILHGHKHYPQIFSYDPDPAWDTGKTPIPQLIVAGGAAGSRTLPDGKERSNTYNVMTIKWNPNALQARVQVVTRGLMRFGPAVELDPNLWKWRTIRVYDRILSPYENLPLLRPFTRSPFPAAEDDLESARNKQYQALRHNMPVVEVLPSLIPGQGYEARVWIVPHSKHHTEFPVNVVWSAGPKFDRKYSGPSSNPDFCASFHYWGPMLIQAELTFAEGPPVFAYVYARLPDAIMRRN